MPSSPSEPTSPSAVGQRLAEQERPLRLVLSHLAGRAIRSRIEIDDLLQEVYLRALCAGASLPEPEVGELALRRFLTHIARHVVIDAARAIRAAKRDGSEERLERSDWSQATGSERLAAQAPGPATGAASNEAVAHIVAAFEGLRPEHRRVIGLRQLEGLSARDVGRRMGRSEVAVHSLYRRALAAWKEALNGPGGEA